MDFFIVIAYLIVVLAIGVYSGRGVKTLSQFSVAGRAFGPWVIFATLSASFIGGGFSLGNAEKVFLFGLMNIFALWGFSLKEILVARFIAPKISKYPNAISVGDIMNIHYGKFAKVLTGILSVVVCAGILGAQVGAMGYIVNVFLGIPKMTGILLCTAIVILYSTVGGMRSVVFTDIVQFIVLAIGIPLTLFFGIYHVGGWHNIQTAIPATHISLLGTGKTLWQFIALFLTFMLGETLVPPYVQRLFLSKDATQTAKGTLWSGLFSIPFFVVTGLIGLVALTINPELNPNLALPFVIKTVLPIGLKGIVVAGMISIVMSSADSFLNAGAVAFSHDVLKPLGKKTMTTKQELFAARLVTFVSGILAIIFAVKIVSILDILLYSYNFWAPIILVPLAAAIIGVKATTKHFVAGALAGVIGVLTWNGLLNNPGGLDGLVIGIFCNAIVFFVLYLADNSRKGKNKTQ